LLSHSKSSSLVHTSFISGAVPTCPRNSFDQLSTDTRNGRYDMTPSFSLPY
jgi:hypothetical protein